MEKVVLVNEKNRRIGTADKATVHTKNTPLHRGFSLFLFNLKNELLLTQRAWSKQTFPGIWTNTVCGHPGPGETVVKAAKRRLRQELGIINSIKIIKIMKNYHYQFTDQNGIVENEICPILVVYTDLKPRPNPKEVAALRWIPWKKFLQEIKENPRNYSPWSVEEAKILEKRLR